MFRRLGLALMIALCGGLAMAQPVGRSGPGDVSGVMRFDATDIPGNDIEYAIGAARSYADCAQRCLANGRCTAFTFNQDNGTCYPKSAIGARQSYFGAVSGIISDRGAYGPPVTRYDGIDFPGNDIAGASGGSRSYDDCAQRCLANGRCTAFTFNASNGMCYPKYSVDYRSRNGSAVSGQVAR